MLVFVTLLFLFPLLSCVYGGINLTYILKKEKNKLQPACIAEELERYAAVGWIYPMPSSEQEIPSVTTKFIPTIENDYNCKFSKNNLCNTRWSNVAWSIDETSTRTRDFIGDMRWEDLPTILISNNTKEFKDRIEIEGITRSAFSIRASDGVELFLCTGWNPHNYPCYHFVIDQRDIYFNKYNDSYRKTNLETYKAFSNILSHDEWRNFVVVADGSGLIQLIDVNLNRTVIEHFDDQQLKPTYLLMKSNSSSLWKIHQNHFIYTKSEGIFRLGPQLTIPSKDLCVSLFVSMCENCKIVFFYRNKDVRTDLKTVGPTENNEWVEIKLKEENIESDKITLFAETAFSELVSNKTEGFWAIDDVRVCNENEVKVSFLKLNESFKDDSTQEDLITCQLVKKPSWRPRKLTYNGIQEFPEIKTTSNTTAIKLQWEQEDPQNQINYFISYQAKDICPLASFDRSMKRIKSNGFLSTKYNEIELTDLVPFTQYNITIATVLHENDRQLSRNTLPTDEPTFDEIPYNIQTRPSDTAVAVSWQKPSCNKQYGPLIHVLELSNNELNFTKKIPLQYENDYRITGLRPFTPYSLQILTARYKKNIDKDIFTSTIVVNFTTLAGAAPSVKNLELYAVGSDYVSFRYDLPEAAYGIPELIQIRRCFSSSSKCKNPFIQPVTACTLWPQKYCAEVDELAKAQKYVFKISLKNANAKEFGKELAAFASLTERVPGVPTNITYQSVDCQQTTDYCHLNISWRHPYNQNGTITSFNIVLNSTDKHIDSEEAKNIHEVYKIVNRTYSPRYTYQIKYVPYSTVYTMYIQSVNGQYESNFTTLLVKIDEIGEHIDQSPKVLGKSDNAFIFKLPHLDSRLQSYTLTIAVQDLNDNRSISRKILDHEKVGNNLCQATGKTWIEKVLKIENNDTERVTIGTNEKHKLKPDTKYCVIFIITNEYKDSEHDVVYVEKLQTLSPPKPAKKASSGPFNHLYMLLLLLLLIPLGFLIYRYLRKRQVLSKPPESKENVYESLPFEDCEPTNAVSNDNYDHLLHK